MDLPTWTITVKDDNESRMILRALVSRLPSMQDGELKAFSETVRDSLRNGVRTISGLNVELIDVADTVQTYYANEVPAEKTELARKQAKVAFDWAGTVYAKVLTKADGIRPGKVVKPEPVKSGKKSKAATGAMSLFGDEG